MLHSLHGTKTGNFRTTKSIQYATTRNYVEKKRLGETILRYQKECKKIMKDLHEKRNNFIKIKYPRLIAPKQSHFQMAAALNSKYHQRTSRYNECCYHGERNLTKLQFQNYGKDIGDAAVMIRERFLKQRSLAVKEQNNKFSLPLITKKRGKGNEKNVVKPCNVPTRLPAVEEN